MSSQESLSVDQQIIAENVTSVKGDVALENPFVIRGHHLPSYALLVRWHPQAGFISPERLAANQTDGFVNELNRMLENPELFRKEAIVYFKDVVGVTEEEAEWHYQQGLNIFRTFTKLPDAYPIDLVEGIKDEICNGCVIGNHCTLKNNPFGNRGTVGGDAQSLDMLIVVARELNLEQDLTISAGIACFSDAEDMNVRIIKTTADTLKRILALSSVFDWDDYANPDFRRLKQIRKVILNTTTAS